MRFIIHRLLREKYCGASKNALQHKVASAQISSSSFFKTSSRQTRVFLCKVEHAIGVVEKNKSSKPNHVLKSDPKAVYGVNACALGR